MSANTRQLPSTFASLDEARDNLAWVESRIKSPDTGWSDYGDIVQDYVDVLAKSFSEGTLDDDECEECYEGIPVKNYPFKRSHIKGWFEDAVQQHGHPQSGSGTLGWTEGMPLDYWIDEHLKKLTVTKYTDSNMQATYKWLFDTGDERQIVETKLHHNSASEFETKIDETFVFAEVGEPTEKYREGGAWKRQFIRPFIRKDDRVSVEERAGPRTKCIESIKDMLEVRTAYFDISSEERYGGPRQEGPTYRGLHAFEITIEEPDRAGEVIDTAVSNGASEVDGVEFTLSSEKRENLREEALQAAMENARSEAGTVAAAEDLRIAGVDRISTTEFDRRPYSAETAALAAGDGGSTSIDSGPVSVSASVTVVYETNG
jgi:hypothetical protein